MSFFSDIVDFVTDTPFLGDIVKAGATVFSTVSQINANKDAASIAGQAAERQRASIQAGDADAIRRLDEIRETSAPAVSQLRTTAITPVNMLQPDQEQQLEELRRNSLRGLNASGLRGSGRATTAVLRNVESDFRTKAIGENRDRRDQAARTLAGPFFSATTGQANVAAGEGVRLGEIDFRVGEDQADAGINNASLRGQALADITSILADSAKKRESRVGDTDEDAERKRREGPDI